MACETVSGAAVATAGAKTGAAAGSGRAVAGEPAAVVSATPAGTTATARPVRTAARRRREMTTGTGSPVGWGSRVYLARSGGGHTSVAETPWPRGQSLVSPCPVVGQDSAVSPFRHA